MTEPDYAKLLQQADSCRAAQPLVRDLANALRCALALKGSLETANTMLVEREKDLTTKLSWEKSSWFWDDDDPEYTTDCAQDLLWDNLTPFEIMGVGGAIETGRRWGFFTMPEEDGDPVYHWFATKAEAQEAARVMKPQAEFPLTP